MNNTSLNSQVHLYVNFFQQKAMENTVFEKCETWVYRGPTSHISGCVGLTWGLKYAWIFGICRGPETNTQIILRDNCNLWLFDQCQFLLSDQNLHKGRNCVFLFTIKSPRQHSTNHGGSLNTCRIDYQILLRSKKEWGLSKTTGADYQDHWWPLKVQFEYTDEGRIQNVGT